MRDPKRRLEADIGNNHIQWDIIIVRRKNTGSLPKRFLVAPSVVPDLHDDDGDRELILTLLELAGLYEWSEYEEDRCAKCIVHEKRCDPPHNERDRRCFYRVLTAWHEKYPGPCLELGALYEGDDGSPFKHEVAVKMAEMLNTYDVYRTKMILEVSGQTAEQWDEWAEGVQMLREALGTRVPGTDHFKYDRTGETSLPYDENILMIRMEGDID